MKLIRQGLERGMFMTFGEKVRSLRKEKKMSQQELASMVGVSYRTIRFWEVEGRFPKQNVLYQKLADALQCDVSYLMSEDEAFITEASEQFGNRGAKQAQQILEQAAAMFAGGSLTDEDKIAFEEIEDMVQNEDLDYFGLCSSLNATPELMSFKLYSLTKRGQAYHMPMEIQSNFLAK